MKISIIVPIYNVEKYLKECFDSIAAQTYEGEQECIFVDDCGLDSSMDILEELVRDYNRRCADKEESSKGHIAFSIVHHEHNGGLSAARNTGIRHATGDYLYFLDSDDSINPDCIERLAALAKKYPGVDIIQGSASAQWKALSMRGKNAPEYSGDAQWIRTGFLSRYIIPVTAWNKLVRTDFLRDNSLYFEEGLIHEDDLWSFLMSKHVRTIAFCEAETYIYRENATGITGSIKDQAKGYIPVLTAISKAISDPDVSTELFFFQGFVKGCTDNNPPINAFLQNIPYPSRLILLLLNLRQQVEQTSKTSLRGILDRLAYHLLKAFINATFPKR